MSRIQHRLVNQPILFGALTTVLTVPAGHKYEILNGSLSGAPQPGGFRGFLATPAGLAAHWTRFDNAPAGWATEWAPDSFCMLAGDSLQVFTLLMNVFSWVTYMDVSP